MKSQPRHFLFYPVQGEKAARDLFIQKSKRHQELGKIITLPNKTQKNISIKLPWHLLFACLEEQSINIHTGDQTQKPSVLPHFCSLATLCIFHTPVQIYFCLVAKSHGQGTAQSLGKKHMSNTDHAYVTHPKVISWFFCKISVKRRYFSLVSSLESLCS